MVNHKDALALWLTNEYGDAVIPEYRFHDKRRWRFDYAIPELDGVPVKVAIEFDGVASHSAHTSITNVLNDSTKFNEAAIMGWIVVRCNTPNLRDGSGYEAITRAVTARKERAA